MTRASKTAKSASGSIDAVPAKPKQPRAKTPVAAAVAETAIEATAKAAAKSAAKTASKKTEKVSAKKDDVAKAAKKDKAGKAPKVAKSSKRSELGPDFICVGLQKGGTQWLYDQLQNHDDFWMPPYKEIHYFDRRFPDNNIGRAARNYAESPERVTAKRDKRGDAPIDERGAAFYAKVLEHDARQGDIGAYGRLFAMKGEKVTGDVTPAYCSLDEKTIRKLAAEFPHMRICLMLREPVSRLWSQWRMHNASKRRPHRAEKRLKTFKKFIVEPEVLARSFPSEIAKRWQAAFGDRFRYFFLDDVASRPDEVRAEIISFLGGDPEKSSNFNPDFNRKAKSRPSKRSKKVQKLMQELFETERAKCAKAFGGAAEKWPDLPY
ncbi:sulfotransferase [Chenggangzhangella methanolivorans]|uniref:sulfotransferase n=1 Tax=Chenggangzhangella methanolivorans TaxID=1437009 RepID=UPI0036245BAD